MFSRVLVANRGEIAARVIRSCKRLGIAAVAAYSEADANSPHLLLADETICVGGPHARDSYLDQDRILAAAHERDCQAIHPGYGFLSENALFAARCRQDRIAFVGPSPESLRVMGDKVSARRAAADVGLPGIPGSEGVLSSAAEALTLATEIGYPVLLKAVAGGGGRGMRVVESAAQLPELFQTAQAESAAAFGCGDLYLERFVTGGRHIEVQVLGDAFGHAIHLGNRECSIQRNHQKLIEESPSPALEPSRGTLLGEQVAEAVRRLRYKSAGTVEFLYDGGRDELYFLEMNTRLQVEHPVTEMITGLDLVEWQLRIAANEPLTLSQADITFSGHAIECRVNAEDPDREFRPSSGTISRLTLPAEESGLRIDTHIAEGYEVPPFYDSMLGKVIAHGADRAAAIARLERGLADIQLEGVPTTIPMHQRVLASEVFRSGDYSTASLPDILATPAGEEEPQA